MNEYDLRVVKTKRALHEAILDLLKLKPLEAISVSAICRKASITRGTCITKMSEICSTSI
ncbi:hypothetical protein [Paenibacillus periandrae]|uniref:hypothetical protein n=1 Tax=Paenibacillus periandrae TaxID=1761741 RepID=UPI001F08A02D|nr:hypothetical protein [Paenibacillus periandrae]